MRPPRTEATMMAELTGQPLLAQIRAARQQPDQFVLIYDLFVDQVYCYMMVRTGQPAAAETLTQRTFLAALEALPRYDERFSFVSWLFGIARQKVKEFGRRRYRDGSGAMGDLSGAGPLPGTGQANGLQIDQVAQRLRLLAPDRAEALALRLFASLSINEIAFLLGQEEPATRLLIFRGMADLRRHLGLASEAES